MTATDPLQWHDHRAGVEEAEALRLTVWAAADGRGQGQLGHTVAAATDTVTAVFLPSRV